MSYKTEWEPYQVTVFVIVLTLCLVFTAWIGTALIRWANEPYYPPQPSSLELSTQACKDRGGIPKTKWVDRDGYSPVEMFDSCEEKK